MKDQSTDNFDIFVTEEILLMISELRENLKHQQMAEPRLLSSHDFALEKLHDTCKVICKEFGFTSASPLAISKLAAIMRSKIYEYSSTTRHFMEHTGRTIPSVADVTAALKYRNVNISEVHDFAKHVTRVRLNALPIFPVPDQDIAKSDEAFFTAMYGPKPSEKELAERPAHILPHMRAMHPDWIEEEKQAKAEEALRNLKTEAEQEQDEFNKLKRINTYRRNDAPQSENSLVAKDSKQDAKTKSSQRRKAAKMIVKSMIPNFEKMDLSGFFQAYDENKKRVAEEQEESAKKAAKAAEIATMPVLQPMAPTVALMSEARLATETTKIDTNSLVSEWCDKLPTFTPDTSNVSETSAVSYEEPGPSFSFSELTKKIKLGGSGSNPGSAPGSRPSSAMGNLSTPEKRFGPGRPKKPKPEPTGPPKPKGRPPKKATLEKRQKLHDLMVANQQKKLEEFKEGKEKADGEKPETSTTATPTKTEKKEKPKKKESIDEQIRAQMLRAKSQMVLPNSVHRTPSPTEKAVPVVPQTPPVPSTFSIAPRPAPAAVPSFIKPIQVQQTLVTPTVAPLIVTEKDVPLGASEVIADEVIESEVTVEESTIVVPPSDKDKKHKKDKWDKNSDEYKEYKRQKKEKRRKEREDRKGGEKEKEVPAKNDTVSMSTQEEPNDPTANPKLKLKIKFGANYAPQPPKPESPMRIEPSSSSSRPESSRSNHPEPAQEEKPNPPPLKFRFKNLFQSTETAPPAKEESVVGSSTPQTSRPGSSMRPETPNSSSSSKHHKKDKKEKKHKREKERDREKEREHRKERERKEKEEETSRRELEEKVKLEMEAARKAVEEEEERKKDKERRREEKKKEKERQKEKQERRERKERERKEKEREAEKERERDAEREKERREKERERERQAEKEKEKEKRREEERKRKEKEMRKKSPPRVPTPEPVRPLIEDRRESSESSESNEDLEELWVCPVCSVAYRDGANMVGCDQCEDWFHWHCVGLSAEPTDAKWFCTRCTKGNKSKKSSKRPASGPGDTSSVKRKKH